MTPEERQGFMLAAQRIEEPYPETVFTPFKPDERERALEALHALGFHASERLHAEWARHWARVLRDVAVEDAYGG